MAGGAGGDEDQITAAIAAEIEQSLDEGKISWQRVIQLARWESLSPEEDPKAREVGRRFYLRAVETFQEQHGGAEVAIFPAIAGGAYLLGNGHLQMTTRSALVRFNWSEAWRLVFQIDALAEEAKEWWQNPSQALGNDDETASAKAKVSWPRRLWKAVNRVPDADRAAAERRPHSTRAYSLATWVIGAIQQESNKHPAPSGTDQLPDPGPEFKMKLAKLRLELHSARQRFRQAAQRTAQSRYWQGTMVGGLLLTVFCLVLGAIFFWRGVDAAYGVALPAGGAGAMVSVLQRMTSGKMVLDIDAGRDLIEVFGAVRPFIGAIFGMAVMALLLGELIPAIQVPQGQELAFFAGFGFLAGFNERWAQDMLKGSADHLRENSSGSSSEAGKSTATD